MKKKSSPASAGNFDNTVCFMYVLASACVSVRGRMEVNDAEFAQEQ